jgi:restriction endonuclease S subunit
LNGRELRNYHVHSGDLVLSARSTSLKMGIVPEQFDGVVLNSTLIGVRPTGALDARLLAAYLRHPDGQAALEAVAQSGTRQMNITVKGLESLIVPVPSKEKQLLLIQLLEASDQAYRSAMEAAESRRNLAIQVVARHMMQGY